MRHDLLPSRRSPAPAARLGLLTAGLLAALLPALASAQQVDKASEKSEWLSLVVGVFLIALVCVGAFMGSKRGHMD